jgi:predicted amino acid-binding ACT domain protein
LGKTIDFSILSFDEISLVTRCSERAAMVLVNIATVSQSVVVSVAKLTMKVDTAPSTDYLGGAVHAHNALEC